MTGITFPNLGPQTTPYGLVIFLRNFFEQIQTASIINTDTYAISGSFDGEQLIIENNIGGQFQVEWTDFNGVNYVSGGSNINTGGTIGTPIINLADDIVLNSGNFSSLSADTFHSGATSYGNQIINLNA